MTSIRDPYGPYISVMTAAESGGGFRKLSFLSGTDLYDVYLGSSISILSPVLPSTTTTITK